MRELTVLYDEECELCCAARGWLERQTQLVPLRFLPAASATARARFPALDPDAVLREMHVVDDDGDVYRGHKAWIICLWALRDYRIWSQRLASPRMQPQAKRFVAWVSRNRSRMGGPVVVQP